MSVIHRASLSFAINYRLIWRWYGYRSLDVNDGYMFHNFESMNEREKEIAICIPRSSSILHGPAMTCFIPLLIQIRYHEGQNP